MEEGREKESTRLHNGDRHRLLQSSADHTKNDAADAENQRQVSISRARRSAIVFASSGQHAVRRTALTAKVQVSVPSDLLSSLSRAPNARLSSSFACTGLAFCMLLLVSCPPMSRPLMSCKLLQHDFSYNSSLSPCRLIFSFQLPFEMPSVRALFAFSFTVRALCPSKVKRVLIACQ